MILRFLEKFSGLVTKKVIWLVFADLVFSIALMNMPGSFISRMLFYCAFIFVVVAILINKYDPDLPECSSGMKVFLTRCGLAGESGAGLEHECRSLA
jgi:hypothetical protein